jgi:hypothetical protein
MDAILKRNVDYWLLLNLHNYIVKMCKLITIKALEHKGTGLNQKIVERHAPSSKLVRCSPRFYSDFAKNRFENLYSYASKWVLVNYYE